MIATVMAIAALILFAAAIYARTHIVIIVKKEPDMPGYKQRIAALEANSNATAQLRTDVDAVTTRMNTVEHDLDNDDPEPQADQPAA